MPPSESVDDLTRTLNELRYCLAANHIDGIRRMVYLGELEWLHRQDLQWHS